MSTELLCADRRDPLIAAAQFNSDMSDALHAQSATLCIYLLDMREYFRWERGLPLDASLPRSELGPWIKSRESAWEALREVQGSDDPVDAYRVLDRQFGSDPFDTQVTQRALAADGLFYGAGVGRYGRPIFFLAETERRDVREGINVVICGRELARGSSAPPAMGRGNEIVVRRDALTRWLWTRFEEWQHHPRESGFVEAWRHYSGGIRPEAHGDPVAVVTAMAIGETESIVLHELGERRIDPQFGDVWHDMLDEFDSRRDESFARALRDLLADCTVTLPTLLDRQADASVHCWFGLIEGLRLKLSPTLFAAYRQWSVERSSILLDATQEAAAHWSAACLRVMDCWRDGGSAALNELFNDNNLSH